MRSGADIPFHDAMNDESAGSRTLSPKVHDFPDVGRRFVILPKLHVGNLVACIGKNEGEEGVEDRDSGVMHLEVYFW